MVKKNSRLETISIHQPFTDVSGTEFKSLGQRMEAKLGRRLRYGMIPR